LIVTTVDGRKWQDIGKEVLIKAANVLLRKTGFTGKTVSPRRTEHSIC
jgi:hypothetical protein